MDEDAENAAVDVLTSLHVLVIAQERLPGDVSTWARVARLAWDAAREAWPRAWDHPALSPVLEWMQLHSGATYPAEAGPEDIMRARAAAREAAQSWAEAEPAWCGAALEAVEAAARLERQRAALEWARWKEAQRAARANPGGAPDPGPAPTYPPTGTPILAAAPHLAAPGRDSLKLWRLREGGR